MRTRFFKLNEEEIQKLDQERFDDQAEEDLQQLVWQQDHTEIVETKTLDGEIAINKQ